MRVLSDGWPMKFQELRDACMYSAMVPTHRNINLTATKGKWPKGFPRGELLNEMERDGVLEQTRSISTEKILSWLKRVDLLRSK